MAYTNVFVVLGALALVLSASASELTFEMDPHAKQCFYEEIAKDTDVTLEYQVIYGGRMDVDVSITYGDNVIFEEQRAQEGSHDFRAKKAGEYTVCFSNEFSTIAHKTVYMDWIVGDEEPILKEVGDHHSALTQIETSLVAVHESLKRVIDYQTHHRMRESTHRHTAEFMNERVQWVSAGEALLLVALSLFQVMYLRNLFSDK
eukprot:m.482208 g.482208  ORF g.482208 m.482208 type:complete len:203 (+) comp22459_c0_seq1:133-741(+)